jgi:hypothetical protein
MDQLRSLMQSALAQRLAEHLRAEVAPVANIPNLRTASVQDRLVGGLRLGTLAPRDLLDTLGLAREGIDYGAKALTGLGALETQKIQQIDNPVLRNAANAGSFLLPGGPITSILALATEAGRDHLPSPVGPADARNAGAAFDQAQGNVVSRLRQANEGFAQDSPLAAGIFNQLYNPLTYLTGGGTAEERALQQSGRISRGLNIDLNTVNGILYPEGHLIGKASSAILGPAVRGVLDRTGLNDILRQRYDLPAAPEAGDLARYLEPQGLPVPDKVPNEPSPLVRDKAPNVLAMARLEAARSKAAAQPALFDLQTTGGQLPRLFDDRLQATGDPLGELVAQVAPPPAPPPPVQPIADLLGAARRVAQPNRLEQLLGAARKVFPEGAGTPLTAAKQASADLAPPAATPQADPLGLMRDLLKSGDNGKGMVYAPADPAVLVEAGRREPGRSPRPPAPVARRGQPRARPHGRPPEHLPRGRRPHARRARSARRQSRPPRDARPDTGTRAEALGQPDERRDRATRQPGLPDAAGRRRMLPHHEPGRRRQRRARPDHHERT